MCVCEEGYIKRMAIPYHTSLIFYTINHDSIFVRVAEKFALFFIRNCYLYTFGRTTDFPFFD